MKMGKSEYHEFFLAHVWPKSNIQLWLEEISYNFDFFVGSLEVKWWDFRGGEYISKKISVQPLFFSSLDVSITSLIAAILLFVGVLPQNLLMCHSLLFWN